MLFWDRLGEVCYYHHLPRGIIFLPGFFDWGPWKRRESTKKWCLAWGQHCITNSVIDRYFSAIFPGLCPLSCYGASHDCLNQIPPLLFSTGLVLWWVSSLHCWSCSSLGMFSSLCLQCCSNVQHNHMESETEGRTGVFSWAQVWVNLHVSVACWWITSVGETCPTWTHAPGKACLC